MLAADDVAVIDIFRGFERKKRVLIDQVIESLGAHAEAGDDLALVHGFSGTGHRPGLDELNGGIGDHLGVDADVLLILEIVTAGGGDAADARHPALNELHS